ncbi:MAG: PIN domain-containing protein [Verrucomicrobiae bacterium]|nr:PIN domain-containing protein [Verrucomicrobiae bacterium]
MRLLVDSNILCRLAKRDDPQHEEARQAVRGAIEIGLEPVACPQFEREFWVVATRPRAKNGLGMTPDEAHKCLRDWREDFFGFAPDTPAVHANWQALVTKYSVSGKEAHDAAIVAAAKGANAEQILTFNTEDFSRFSPEIAIRTPKYEV